MAYDEDTRAMAVAMVDEGRRVADAAAAVGATGTSVRNWCAAAGVVPHAPRARGRTWPVGAEARERALALVLAGGSATGAAREVGVGASTVCAWCARGGVALRTGRLGGPADPRLGGRLLVCLVTK